MISIRPPKITGGWLAMDADGIGEALISFTTEVKQKIFVNIRMLQMLYGPARDVKITIQLARARIPTKKVSAVGR
jgi:hypothetical protein